MRIEYSMRELGKYVRDAFISVISGFLRLMWGIVLFVINLAMLAKRAALSAIRGWPLAAVGVVGVVGIVGIVGVYAQMKTRLNTAEWQRDRVELRLDSVCKAFDIENGAVRFQGVE